MDPQGRSETFRDDQGPLLRTFKNPYGPSGSSGTSTLQGATRTFKDLPGCLGMFSDDQGLSGTFRDHQGSLQIGAIDDAQGPPGTIRDLQGLLRTLRVLQEPSETFNEGPWSTRRSLMVPGGL